MKIFYVLSLIFIIAAVPVLAQNEDFSFQVDNTVPVPATEDGDGLTEAEEDAAYAGDKSDIRTEEDDENLSTLPVEDLTSIDEDAESAYEGEDPCAVYQNPRAKDICEDRLMKIDRMKAAREKRRNVGAPVLKRDAPAAEAIPAEDPGAPAEDVAAPEEGAAAVDGSAPGVVTHPTTSPASAP